MVRRAFESAHSPLIIAADGGARIAQHFDLSVHVVVGDMDSLSQQELDALIAQGADVHRHPPEKDYNDLELALRYTAETIGADWIRIIGGIGDRLDQTLANVYLLALPVLEGRDVRIVAGNQETFLLKPGTHPIIGRANDTISLIPIDRQVDGIRTEGLYYPLCDESLFLGASRGISNVMSEDVARITIRQGRLLLVHTIGRA